MSFASRYRAAQTRLRRFEDAGPPEERPPAQELDVRLRGERTGRRAVVAAAARAHRAHERRSISRSGTATASRCSARTARASRTSCGCSRAAAPTPTRSSATSRRSARASSRSPHEGRAVLGARVVPGWFAQTHRHPEFRGRTLLDILHRGDDRRTGLPTGCRELGPRSLRPRPPGRADVRDAVGRSAGAVPDPDARALGRDAAAARRADRQPRPRLGRGARGCASRDSRARCSP